MVHIGILYKIEKLIKNKTPKERYEERQKQSRPVIDALFEWLHSMKDSVDRYSLIGDAILFTLNQETYLRRYLEDGHLSIDNTSTERAIKNFAVGRRNWLFAKSIRGAYQFHHIQHHRDSSLKWCETICISDIYTGSIKADGTLPKTGRAGSASPLVG